MDFTQSRKVAFLLLMLLLALPPTRGRGGGGGLEQRFTSCDHMVCDCSRVAHSDKKGKKITAVCADKGFNEITAILDGLPRNTEDLNLAGNNLEVYNASETLRFLPKLSHLDVSRNNLRSFFADGSYNHGRLISLDLSSNNISDVKSLRLDGLTALAQLNLDDNRIKSLPPNPFQGIEPQLKVLSMRSNGLAKLERDSLKRFESLETLLLTKNQLTGFSKGLFSEMKQLITLDLNKNRLSQIQGLAFHGLTNLKVLRLKRNGIEFLMDGALFGLESVEEIHLDRNRVQVIDKGWLYGMESLLFLSLAQNDVDFIHADSWEYCRNLTEIDLRYNKLKTLGRQDLSRLPSLSILKLDGNEIAQFPDSGTFDQVPRLTFLSLSENRLSYPIEDGTAPFKGLNSLRNLQLNRNPIKAVGERAFEGLDELQVLDLTSNPISTLKENAFSNLKNLVELKINSSSLLCDCYLKWFPVWLHESKVVGSDEAACAHPQSLKGTTIDVIPQDQYLCEDFPKPYLLEHPKTQIALYGENLSLSCRAASTSSAEMSFSWKVGSNVIEVPECEEGESETVQSNCFKNTPHLFDGKGREITSVLKLTNLRDKDAGEYQCVVSNKFGATYSDKAEIEVYVFPTFVTSPTDVVAESGSKANLECAARGVPAPKVYWSKDAGLDFPAATERRIAVSNYQLGGDLTTNVNSFTIYSVKAKDTGIYQCFAENPAGKISWNISLSVLELPRLVEMW